MVYVSSATRPFEAQALVDLLEISRANNTRRGLTGLLLYHDGNFMQALEGSEAAVRTLYARISQDSRHAGCIVLMQQSAPERVFGDWSMGFRDLRAPELRSRPGFSDYLDPGAVLPSEPSRAWRLLKSFRESLR